MTAPLTPCPACNEGLLRYDPQTGETRCGNCWARDTDAAPLVKGGQGRDAESLWDDAKCGLVIAAGFAVFVALLAWAVQS